MRVSALIVFLLAGATAALGGQQQPAALDFAHMSSDGQDVRTTVLGDGIYQFTVMRDAYVRQLNTVVIVNDKDVLVFDTNTRPSSARIVLSEIRKITGKPIRYAVNSHHHPDHWSGNEVYAEAFPGVDFIASERTLELMHDSAALWPRRFAADLSSREEAMAKERSTGKQEDGTPLTPRQRQQDEDDLRNYRTFVEESAGLHRIFPTLTYAGNLTLRQGGREFRFLSVTGDAEGSTVLYLPKERMLVTGDAVSYPIPYVSAHPREQAESLAALARLDVEVIVPGHGPAFHDKSFLALELRLIDSVLKGVREGLRGGAQNLAELQRAVTVDELRDAFAHGDADLESRFRDRVRFLVKVACHEYGQQY